MKKQNKMTNVFSLYCMQNLIILSTQYKISDSSGNSIDAAENQLLMLNLKIFIIKFDMTVHYICIFCTHK